ncbi:MAG TPA: TonB C-terminal domain-containing protein [Candidatus Polarisedimenticolia bacterium]|nr:TonB C-terminal domain-containing protein [Candidatus Polarisedimenticolia bacterium]
MEFISLNHPEPPGRRSLTRVEALLLSFGLHLLVVLLALYLPEVLPESVIAFFRPRPALLAVSRPESTSRPESVPRLERPKIPLKFVTRDSSVRVPNDVAVPKNPDAPILSNRNRRARQEAPTPPHAKELSFDPHSAGDTIERIRPDPTRRAGHDTPEEAPSPPPAAPRPATGTEVAQGEGGAPGAPGETGDGGGGARPEPSPAEAGGLLVPRPREKSGGRRGPPGAAGTGQGVSPEALESLRRALTSQAEEEKRTFDNPGFLENGAFGTMSFDTQDFPWGDYDHAIYVIIRNSWIDRIPLASRAGLKDFVCAHFMIERDGTISRIDMEREASVPPYNRAVNDTLRAVSPLPPLPKDFPEEREGATYCFFYHMLPGEIREFR